MDSDTYWGMRGVLRTLIEDKLSVDLVDSRGHLSSWRFDPVSVMRITDALTFATQDIDQIVKALESNEPLPEPVRIKFNVLDHQACSRCRNGAYLFDGLKFVAEEECALKDGIPLKVRLEVPSGKLVVGNDFREWFDHGIDEDAEFDRFYVNTEYGISETVKAYAEHGSMLHFFVGNSSPDVYPTDNPNEFMVANPEWSEDPVECKLNGHDSIGSICTDLWWVCIVDHDEAVKRGMPIETGGWADDFIIEVEPGTYELDYNYLLASHVHYPAEGDEIFASLKRVS